VTIEELIRGAVAAFEQGGFAAFLPFGEDQSHEVRQVEPFGPDRAQALAVAEGDS
jgi:hypothetical protein